MQVLYFFFSIVSYLVGISSLVYFFWTIKFGIQPGPDFTMKIALWNCAIFLIFPLQHSILPRNFIKTRISTYLHRSFYVLTSGIALWIVLLQWRPAGPFLYQDVAPWFFNILFYASLVLIVLSTIALNHSRMFGLYQGYAAWRGKPVEESPNLQTDGIYGIVRHPLTSLLLVALWSHESLTTGQLLFNSLFSIYALVGTVFEEKSLVKELGNEYLDYRKKVPAFIPRFLGKKRDASK